MSIKSPNFYIMSYFQCANTVFLGLLSFFFPCFCECFWVIIIVNRTKIDV